MTWTKTGEEFPDELAEMGVSDALYRTHHEVISYLCRREKASRRFKAPMLRSITFCHDVLKAADEAVRLGVWEYDAESDEYEVVHYGREIAEGLAAVTERRASTRDRVRRHRERNALQSEDVTGDVTRYSDESAGQGVLDLDSTGRSGVTRYSGSGLSDPPPCQGEGRDQVSSKAKDKEKEKGTRKRAERAHSFPADTFALSADDMEWARANHPGVDLDNETAWFVDWAKSSGRKYKRWDLTWRNWVRRVDKDETRRNQPRPAQLSISRGDAAKREADRLKEAGYRRGYSGPISHHREVE